MDKAKDFFKNVQWGRVAIFGVIAIGVIFLFHALFKKNGILGRSVNVLEDTTSWGTEQLEKGIDVMIDAHKRGWNMVEKGAAKAWEWWTGDDENRPPDTIPPDK